VVYDARADRLVIMAHSVAETEDALTAEATILDALARLLRRYGSSVAGPRRPSPGGLAARVRDVLQERVRANLPEETALD
jgi:hypothetical protein